LISPSIALTR